MLVLPPIVGWVVGGFSWVNLLFLPTWWGSYLTYWSWSQWLRTRSARKRALIMLPLLVYTGWTAALALITLLAAPYLIQWWCRCCRCSPSRCTRCGAGTSAR